MLDPYEPCPRCVHCNDMIDAYSAVIVVSEDGATRRTILGVGFLRRDVGLLFHAQCHSVSMSLAPRN